jgi:hypothetical protein
VPVVDPITTGRGECTSVEEQDAKREQLYELVDALEATTKELAQGDSPLSPRAEATILDDLNEIRHVAAEDTSAGEYLADDDRTKAQGYNHLPHRPGHPHVGRQRDEVRRGERRREGDAVG